MHQLAERGGKESERRLHLTYLLARMRCSVPRRACYYGECDTCKENAIEVLELLRERLDAHDVQEVHVRR